LELDGKLNFIVPQKIIFVVVSTHLKNNKIIIEKDCDQRKTLNYFIFKIKYAQIKRQLYQEIS
jgi:hypothetical protein